MLVCALLCVLWQEREAGHPQFIKFGDSKGVSGVGHSLLRILKRKLGVTGRGGGDGTGNTALAFHAVGARLKWGVDALLEGWAQPHALPPASRGEALSVHWLLPQVATHTLLPASCLRIAAQGKLLALHEGDLPYQLRLACEGLVQTLGRLTFGGEVQHCFTAHPKVDPETGELLFFG